MTQYINLSYIKESPYVDWKHYENEAQILLNQISSISWSFLFWLIWPYGSGKSTMLNTFSKLLDKDHFFFTFDARKYPDRKELWDWFILDFAANLLSEDLSNILNNIDWIKSNQNKRKELWISASKILITSGLAAFDLYLLRQWISNTSMFSSKEIGELFDIIRNTFQKNPKSIKRLNEYDILLKELLQSSKFRNKEIYIVLEDIDRAWIEGIVFLETLCHLINSFNNNYNTKLVFICPIDTNSLETNFQKYLKVFEYYDFFSPSIDIKKFVNSLFTQEMSQWFLSIIKQMINGLPAYTMREIKFIIRNIYQEYIINPSKDKIDRYLHLLLHMIFLKKNHNYFDTNDQEHKKWIKKHYHYKNWFDLRHIGWLEEIINREICKHINDKEKSSINNENLVIKFTTHDNIQIDQNTLYVPNFYFI